MFNPDRALALAAERGLKKSYICKEMGVGPGFFSEFGQGKRKNVTVAQMEILCKLLITTSAYLNSETDDPSPSDTEKTPPAEGQEGSGKKAELIAAAGDLPDDDIQKVIEYVGLLKLKRKQ